MAVKAYGRSVYRRPKKLTDFLKPTPMPKRTGGRGKLPGFAGGPPRKAGRYDPATAPYRTGYQPGQVSNPGRTINGPTARRNPIGGFGAPRRRKRPRAGGGSRRYF